MRETNAAGIEFLNRGSDYALRAMEVLAEGWGKGPVSASHIADKAGVAEPMLRKLLQKLAKARLVLSVRGVAGGFRLVRRPRDISYLEVIEAVQGLVAVNRCNLDGHACADRPHCSVRRHLGRVQLVLVRALGDLNLAGIYEFGAAGKAGRSARSVSAAVPNGGLQ